MSGGEGTELLLAVCQLIDTEPAYYMWISMDQWSEYRLHLAALDSLFIDLINKSIKAQSA